MVAAKEEPGSPGWQVGQVGAEVETEAEEAGIALVFDEAAAANVDMDIAAHNADRLGFVEAEQGSRHV